MGYASTLSLSDKLYLSVQLIENEQLEQKLWLVPFGMGYFLVSPIMIGPSYECYGWVTIECVECGPTFVTITSHTGPSKSGIIFLVMMKMFQLNQQNRSISPYWSQHSRTQIGIFLTFWKKDVRDSELPFFLP